MLKKMLKKMTKLFSGQLEPYMGSLFRIEAGEGTKTML
jgi:hypothetical protein